MIILALNQSVTNFRFQKQTVQNTQASSSATKSRLNKTVPCPLVIAYRISLGGPAPLIVNADTDIE